MGSCRVSPVGMEGTTRAPTLRHAGAINGACYHSYDSKARVLRTHLAYFLRDCRVNVEVMFLAKAGLCSNRNLCTIQIRCFVADIDLLATHLFPR